VEPGPGRPPLRGGPGLGGAHPGAHRREAGHPPQGGRGAPPHRPRVTLYYELRRTLLPEECDAQTITEIRRLLARDITLKEAKRILEKHIIENTLRKTGGNITHAAKELGIHRPQLSNLLKKYALKRELYERDFDIRLNPLDN
jgi:hypothetical protein